VINIDLDNVASANNKSSIDNLNPLSISKLIDIINTRQMILKSNSNIKGYEYLDKIKDKLYLSLKNYLK
jgi:predicted transcriptional regulator